MSPDAHIYQIYYSEQTRAALDPGFIPLDNLRNERPDWREYWPIRNFLRSQPLEERDFYGFLSPRFQEKTRLSAAAVHDFLSRCPADTDVALFSPFFDQIALFANSFEQAVRHHPNALEAFRLCGPLIDPRLDPGQCLMSSLETVYCNYFVARARFWRVWLERCERIFDIAENQRTELARLLNAATSHDLSLAPTKVFVLERVASALLATDPTWRVAIYDPIAIPHRTPCDELGLVVLDALKVAYRVRSSPAYLQAYHKVREQILSGPRPGPAP